MPSSSRTGECLRSCKSTNPTLPLDRLAHSRSPMFFSSNYFYSYQGAITAYLFNGRTRALTSLLTGLGSILGSLFIGMITDYLPFKRRHRALGACAAVFILNIIVWTGGIVFQTTFSRTSVGHRLPAPWDWTDGAAVGPLILLMSCEQLHVL